MRVFVESTIPSYLAARPARDLLQAARQSITRDWWSLRRQEHELYTSQIVLDEIACGDEEFARLRLQSVQEIPILELTDESLDLSHRILRSGLLPANADRDASHIAVATVHEMEVLLTWNCRHIANAAIQAPLRRLAARSDYELPVICTPEELMAENYE